MAEDYIQLQPDSTGKKVQNFKNTRSGNDVYAQAACLVNTAGDPVAPATSSGAANAPITRGTASTTAATLVIARATRREALILNMDASIRIYVGPAPVTSANGFPIEPGQSLSMSWVGLIQVIAASGTPAYAVLDEYD